jgi:hypothetical protein
LAPWYRENMDSYLVMFALTFGVLVAALVAVAIVARRRFLATLELWRRFGVSRGGSVAPHLSLRPNAPVLVYTEPTPVGTARIGQRRGGGGTAVTYGEWIGRIELFPGVQIPAFLLGDLSWAGIWARWASGLPRCDGLGPGTPHPLDKGGCELKSLGWFSPQARELALGLEHFYLAYGRGQEIVVHVQGELAGAADVSRLERTIALLQAIAASSPLAPAPPERRL